MCRVPGELFGGSGGSGVCSGCCPASPPTSSIKRLQRQPRGSGRGRAGAMAEGRSGSAGLFARQVQKRFSRAQEKVRRCRPPPKSQLRLRFVLLSHPQRSQGVPKGAARLLWGLRGWEFWGVLWVNVVVAPSLWRMASPKAPRDTLASLMVGRGFPPQTPCRGYGGGCGVVEWGSLGWLALRVPSRARLGRWSQGFWGDQHRK